MNLRFEISGVPFSKQSFRVAKRGNYIHKYQKKEVIDKERALSVQVKSQLPRGFVPFSKFVKVKSITYIFPPTQKLKKAVERGEIIYKTTKPDLTDNLQKGLFDAMEGIVFDNDSRVCEMNNLKKIYGLEPKTIIEMEGE